MSRKTSSEAIFEQFCSRNSIPADRVPEGKEPSPDYCIQLGTIKAYVEVKQLDEDAAFSPLLSRRTVGDHVRAKINEARNQVRTAAKSGAPAILLIYNNLDPQQRFGTEQHDFIAAMYGEPTVSVSMETGQILDSFHGKNKALREDKNQTFSAIGQLRTSPTGEIAVHLYENIHALVALSYDMLPPCITFNRIELERDA